ncbi:MAG: hypothetical protein JWN61_1778, partial [Pseudonocardiales bacterium]|nr:hypothetical protein [Pseudonocardiales bacterium]
MGSVNLLRIFLLHPGGAIHPKPRECAASRGDGSHCEPRGRAARCGAGSA